MRDVPCALCQKPLGDSIRSGYTPYATHADKRICVENIRADERRQVILDGEAGIIYHDLEAEWRADERKKIGDAIDARRKVYMLNEAGTGTAIGAYVECEQIARSGGRAEVAALKRWLAFDIGCIECGEPSRVIGTYATEAEAYSAAQQAAAQQAADWHGQHEFEVYDLCGGRGE